MSGTLIVLTTLWYSPLLQTIASMFDCFEDIENNDELVLVSDPSVSCEPSFSRHLVYMHALFAAVFVGAGFPLFSFFKIRQLKKLGKLDASSSFSSLYQFYNTDAPYFESFLFLRKATLILSGELRTRYLIAWLCSSIPNSDTENTPTLYALLSFIIQRSYLRILPQFHHKWLLPFPSDSLTSVSLFPKLPLRVSQFVSHQPSHERSLLSWRKCLINTGCVRPGANERHRVCISWPQSIICRPFFVRLQLRIAKKKRLRRS